MPEGIGIKNITYSQHCYQRFINCLFKIRYIDNCQSGVFIRPYSLVISRKTRKNTLSMSRINSQNIWIEAGYEQFANEGLEGIQPERLARITSLNKSGYYHYFGDQESFLEHLMVHHTRIAERMANETRQIRHFDPDFLNILINNPITVMAHMQLVRNRKDKFFQETYSRINTIIDPVAAKPWAVFLGTPNDYDFALRYFEHVRDMFYSRITYDTLNYEYLRNLIVVARELMHYVSSKASPLI